MKNIIDLHCHSCASLDGTYQPEELIDMALAKGLKYLAIADHDVLTSIPKAVAYAKDKDLTLIPAVELSCEIHDIGLHILSYNIDYNDERYLKRQDSYVNDLKDYGKQLLYKAHEFGFKFDDEVVYNYRQDHLICEELLGKAILADHRNDNDERLIEFRTGGSLAGMPHFNFFKKFCTHNGPLSIPYKFNINIKDAAKLIHETHGKMVLAHPNHNIGHNLALFKEILSYGLDGIEVFSSYHHQEDIDFFYQLAKQNNLFMSVGSDFHGESKPLIELGSIDYDVNELNKTLNQIL